MSVLRDVAAVAVAAGLLWYTAWVVRRMGW